MTRAAIPQLNVRSAFAVKRAADLARKAGTTTTKVVEDALRAYDVDDVVKGRQNWHDELRDIVRRAKKGSTVVRLACHRKRHV